MTASAQLQTLGRSAKTFHMSDNLAATLGRMAVRGTLEVEHLLRAARQPSLSLADALDKLAADMSWALAPCFPEVPFGTWVRVVGVYCRRGHAGLLEAASETEMLPFVLGLLEELKTDEALSTVIQLASACPQLYLASAELAGQIAGALNLAAKNSPMHGPCEAEREAGRDFLHSALTRVVADNHRGTILCALRHFGDETSLRLVATCPPLPPAWEPTRSAAARAIKKAMKQRTALS